MAPAGEPSGVTPTASDREATDGAIGGRAVRGFAWQVVSLGGNRVLLFVSTLVLARLLDPSDFGIFAAALTFTAYLEVLLDFGVGSFLVFDQEEGVTDRVHTAFTVNVIMTAVLTVLAVATSPLTARLLGAPHRAGVFAVTSLYLIGLGLTQINNSMIQRDMHFHKGVIISLAGAAARASLTVVFALLGWGVWAIVGGFLLGQLVNLIATWTLVRYRPRLRFDPRLARRMLRFGAGGVALDLVDAMSLNADYLVVGAVLGDVALGFYSIAYRLADLLINNALWMFGAVAFPVYSKSRDSGPAVLRHLMLRALRLTTIYGFVAGIGLALLSRDLILIVFGTKWSHAVGAMTVLGVSAAFGCLGYASGPLFPAMGKPAGLMRINLPRTVLMIVGFVVVAPYGIIWVAVVHLVTNLVSGVIRIAYVDRLLEVRHRASLRAVGPATTMSLGMVAVGLPVRMAMPQGWTSLGAVTAAAVLGATLGAAVWGRSVFHDLLGVARHLRLSAGGRSTEPGLSDGAAMDDGAGDETTAPRQVDEGHDRSCPPSGYRAAP